MLFPLGCLPFIQTFSGRVAHLKESSQEIKMYFSVPLLNTARTYKNRPGKFLDIVDQFLDYFDQIEALEDSIANAIVRFAQDTHVTLGYYGAHVTFRKCLKLLTSGYRKERRKFSLFLEAEELMDAATHEDYLKTWAILETIGHLILNQSRIQIGTRLCTDCETFYIETRANFTSLWSAKVLLRIDLPEDDSDLIYRFGRYDPVLRDFI